MAIDDDESTQNSTTEEMRIPYHGKDLDLVVQNSVHNLYEILGVKISSNAYLEGTGILIKSLTPHAEVQLLIDGMTLHPGHRQKVSQDFSFLTFSLDNWIIDEKTSIQFQISGKAQVAHVGVFIKMKKIQENKIYDDIVFDEEQNLVTITNPQYKVGKKIYRIDFYFSKSTGVCQFYGFSHHISYKSEEGTDDSVEITEFGDPSTFFTNGQKKALYQEITCSTRKIYHD